jgi:hypothetical protein
VSVNPYHDETDEDAVSSIAIFRADGTLIAAGASFTGSTVVGIVDGESRSIAVNCGGKGGKPGPCPRKVKEQRKPTRTAAPKLNEKAQKAKAAHKMVDKEIQRYAEDYIEPLIARQLGGKVLDDNEPVDVQTEKHGFEVKTMVSNKHDKITMKRSAMERKADWERKNKQDMHTVVVDDNKVFNAKGQGKHDESQRVFYYRRGYGSFRVENMHKVTSVAELKKLMDTPDDELPETAKRPKGQKRGRLA